jgi:hypothetical protein
MNLPYWTLDNFICNSKNTGNLSALITEAVNICQPEYCRMPGFTGNADITGIGVCCHWTLLCLIYHRDTGRSKKVFRPSYGNNAMGYGRIIASGFCLEVIVQWLCLVFSRSQLNYTYTKVLKEDRSL